MYARQSDSKGAGAESLSIESMVTELTRWCEAEGWDIVRVIKEADLRGWMDDTQRPGIAEALDLARDGAYDLLLTWDLSRFARSVRIQEDLIYRLAALGVEVRSKSEPHLNHSPMVRQIMAAVNEERTREISKHVRRSLRERTRQGIWHGPAPYGHRRGGDGRLVPHEEEAAVVREIVRRVAAGQSYRSIAAGINAHSTGSRGQAWTFHTVRIAARNPAHVGVCWAGDVAVEGAHPAIVDRAEWDRCQARIADATRRARRVGSVPTFLSGRAWCGCGMPMYPVRMVKVKPNGRRYPGAVLRCRTNDPKFPTCTQPRRSVSLAVAHRFVRERLARDLAAAVPWRTALAHARADHRRAAPDAAVHRERLEAQRDRLGRKLRLIDDAYYDGLSEKADWARRREAATAELAAVDGQLAAVPAEPDPDAYRDAGAVVAAMRAAVEGADDEAIAGALVALGAALHLGGGELELRYSSPFDRIIGARS